MSDLLDGPFGRVESLRNIGETRYAFVDMERSYGKIELAEQITYYPDVDSGKVRALALSVCFIDLLLQALVLVDCCCCF